MVVVILLAVCVDKPIPKREKIRIGYCGEINFLTTVMPYFQIVFSGEQTNLTNISCLLTSILPNSFIFLIDSS